jgi:hypothetical protein
MLYLYMSLRLYGKFYLHAYIYFWTMLAYDDVWKRISAPTDLRLFCFFFLPERRCVLAL